MRFFILLLAVGCCTIGFSQNRDDAAFRSRVLSLIDDGKYLRANELADSMLLQYPDDLQFHEIKAKTLFEIGQRDSAISLIENVISISPRDVVFLNTYANMLSNSYKNERADSILVIAYPFAVTDYERCLVRETQALVKRRLKDYKAALLYIDDCIATYPNNYRYRLQKGNTYLEMKQYKNALEQIEAASKLTSNWYIKNNLALVYSLTGDYQQAIAIYLDLLKTEPRNPRVLNNLGYAYVQAGQEKKGIEYINRSIKVWPDNSYAYRNLGLAYLQLKEREKACESFAKALELNFSVFHNDEVEKLQKKHCK